MSGSKAVAAGISQKLRGAKTIAYVTVRCAIEVPAGTVVVGERRLILPDGRRLSVWPVFEAEFSGDVDEMELHDRYGLGYIEHTDSEILLCEREEK